MEKILFKQSNGLICVIRTLLCRGKNGKLILNKVVLTQIMQTAQVTQIQQLSGKTQKNKTKKKKTNKLVLADHKLKLREIAEELNISEGSVLNISQWESCVQNGCCVCSQSIKNKNASTIQNVFCKCLNATKRSFCENVGQWMKHGSNASLWSQSAVGWWFGCLGFRAYQPEVS